MFFPPLILAGLALLGLVVGYTSGLFGVGGGFIMTPLLIALFGIAPETAVGSGLAQMIVVGLNSAWRHGVRGYTDLRAAVAMAPGILLGTYAGKAILGWLMRFGDVTVLKHRTSLATVVLDLIFIGLLLVIALRLWREDRTDEGADMTGPLCWPDGPARIKLPASDIPRVSLLSLTASGVVIGIMAGLLGIGGGVILVPLLLYGYRIGLRMAIGTSALLILVSAVAGTIQYAYAGHVNLWIVIPLTAGALLGVQAGTWHSHRLSHRCLQHAFALLIVAVVLVILVKFII